MLWYAGQATAYNTGIYVKVMGQAPSAPLQMQPFAIVPGKTDYGTSTQVIAIHTPTPTITAICREDQKGNLPNSSPCFHSAFQIK